MEGACQCVAGTVRCRESPDLRDDPEMFDRALPKVKVAKMIMGAPRSSSY